MNLEGFDHGNRGIGIRHHQLILPSVICSTHVSRRIATEVSAVTFAHQHGCAIIGDDVAGIDNFFVALADHPNVGSVLAVGLGCETIQSQELAAKLASRNESTHHCIIQESGGVEGTVTAGVLAARQLAEMYPPQKTGLIQLHIGIELGRVTFDISPVTRSLKDSGFQIEVIESHGNSAEAFSKLAELKSHLIISFPAENQPSSGFPLIPVINVAGTGLLHQATFKDFDLQETELEEKLISLIESVVSGKLTIAEKNRSGEIRAPRVVRSV